MHVAVDCVLPPYGRFADYAKQEAQGSVQLEWLESPRSSSSSLSSLMSPLTRPVAALFTRTLDGMLYGSSAKDVDLPPALSMGMPPSAYESVPREEHGTRLENRFFVMVMDNTVSDVVGLEKLNHIIRYNRSNVV